MYKHIDSYNHTEFKLSFPNTPFEQLLSILPPESSNLLPAPLSSLLTSKDSPLKIFCPNDIKIDLAGKRKEWEGIVLLPMIDKNIVHKSYISLIDKVELKDKKRNRFGKTYKYIFNKNNIPFVFECYYGTINKCQIFKIVFYI